MEKVNGDVNLDGIHFQKDNLLSGAACEALVRHFDVSTYKRAGVSKPTFGVEQLSLSQSNLAGVIGEESVRTLLAFLFNPIGEAAVSSITIRRVYADGVHRMGTVDWHTHEEASGFREGSLNVALNAEEDLAGGDLYVLGRDGPVRAPRFRCRGQALPYIRYPPQCRALQRDPLLAL